MKTQFVYCGCNCYVKLFQISFLMLFSVMYKIYEFYYSCLICNYICVRIFVIIITCSDTNVCKIKYVCVKYLYYIKLWYDTITITTTSEYVWQWPFVNLDISWNC